MGIFKKKTLIDLSAEKEKRRREKNKRVFKDGVNQRANIKQREVVQSIKSVVPCAVQVEEPDLGKKVLIFDKLTNLERLTLTYFCKNNLFARIFDLVAEAVYEPNVNHGIKDDIEIGMTYLGSATIKDCAFTIISGSDSADKLLGQLNANKLLKKRVLHLQVLDLKIKYNGASGRWDLGIATGKGSVVWMLFPPLVQLTPLDETDAIKLIELFQLLTGEIKSFYTAT